MADVTPIPAVFYQCWQDGVPKGAMHRKFDDAWMQLLDLQPFSTSWAFKHGGWRIVMIDALGNELEEGVEDDDEV